LKKILVIAGLAAIHAAASAAPGANEAFSDLADRYLNETAERSPVAATALGDHRADDRLDDVDAAARSRTRNTFAAYRETLAAIDRDELSRANQVDAAILHNNVESTLFNLDTLEEWAWNPLYYVRLSGNSVYGLLSRDFARQRSMPKQPSNRIVASRRSSTRWSSLTWKTCHRRPGSAWKRQWKPPVQRSPNSRRGWKRNSCRGPTAIFA
jgi:hypothetical protein